MGVPADFPNRVFELPCTITIATNTTVSAAVDLGGCTLVGVRTPAQLTGTSLSFQAVDEAGNSLAVHKTDGNALSLTVAAGRHIPLDPKDFQGIWKIKLVSGSEEAANRTFTLLVRP